MGATDTNLWAQLKGGDEVSFNALFERYYAALLNYGVSLGATREHVRDCIQDLFSSIWLYRSTLAEAISVKAYLFGGLRKRISRTHERNRVLGRSVDLDEALFLAEFTVQDHLIADEESRERIRHLNQLLNGLPSRQKEAIYLRFYQDFAVDQIALMMDISYQSVSNLIYRGLSQLRNAWLAEFVLVFMLLASC